MQIKKKNPKAELNKDASLSYGLVFAMVWCSYAVVPLYRRFCQAISYGGTAQRRLTLASNLYLFLFFQHVRRFWYASALNKKQKSFTEYIYIYNMTVVRGWERLPYRSLFLCRTALEDQKRHEKLSFLKMDERIWLLELF